MPVIEKSINLNVPTASAFRYLSQVTHIVNLCPNLIEIDNLQRHSPDVMQFAWIFKMCGVRFEGTAEIKQTHHDQQIDIYFRGGIHGHMTWQFQPLDGNTLLEMRLDYVLPVPLLKKHTEDTILWQNEQSVEAMLTRLKTHLETSVTGQLAV
jgi:hypothetical protein